MMLRKDFDSFFLKHLLQLVPKEAFKKHDDGKETCNPAYAECEDINIIHQRLALQ